MHNVCKHFVHLTLLACIAGTSAVFAQDSEQLIRLLRDRYDTVNAMKAAFKQTTSSSYLDDSEYFEGDITLQGDKYRIEMSNQTIVTDTELTWVYNRADNQVLISDFEQDENSFSLSTFFSDFDTAYDIVDFSQSENLSILKLVPTDPFSMFRSVSIWVNRDVVEQLEVLDMNDVMMTFALSDIQFNPNVAEPTFTFVIPEGVEVVDLREEY